MEETTLGKVLHRAAQEPVFLKRMTTHLGQAVAEEGFVLTDGEMRQLRGYWEALEGLSDRQVYEKVSALARGHRG